jgi:hypothetical protein
MPMLSVAAMVPLLASRSLAVLSPGSVDRAADERRQRPQAAS